MWELEPRDAAILAAILVATALIYMPSIRNGWVYDDVPEIVNATELHSWAGVGQSFLHDVWWFRDPTSLPQSSYYRPLQTAWFGLNYMLLGDHPTAWHLEKIALELVGVMLTFRLAQLISGSNAVGLLTAAIFGLLPANVESVVWASAIPEPLSTIFEMGALCCLIQRKPGTWSGWSRGMMFALILYAGALMSHETAILFWLIVAAYAFLIERRRVGESIRLAAPFILIAIVYLCARLNVLGTEHFIGLPHLRDPNVVAGWAGPAATHGPIELVLTAPVVLLVYLGVLIVPGIAAPAHDVQWVASADSGAFVAAGILAAVAAIAAAAIWRSENRRLYLFCAAWSLLTIAPAMKLNALATLVEERLLYAPSVGWSLALALTVVNLGAVSPRWRAGVATAMGVLLAAYAVSIVRMEGDWHDDLTFYARCEELSPHDPTYVRTRVTLLNANGDLNSALNVLQEAVNRDPDNFYLHLRLADQYSKMQRGGDFVAEVAKARALRAKARAAHSSPNNPVPLPAREGVRG
jgi:tetratricopeptide (TPR) repeat protein